MTQSKPTRKERSSVQIALLCIALSFLSGLSARAAAEAGGFAAQRTAHLKALADAKGPEKSDAASNLIQFYFQYGLTDEARGVLSAYPQAIDGEGTIAAALTALHDGNLSTLMERARNGDHEACIWLAALAAPETDRLTRTQCGQALVQDFPSYFQWFLERYLSSVLAGLVDARDYDAARALIDGALARFPEGAPSNIANAAAFGEGLLFAARDQADEAVSAFDRVASPPRLVAEARLRRTALLWRLGMIEVDAAAADLARISRSWRGDEIEAVSLLGLAQALHFSSSPFFMLDALIQTQRNFPSTAYADEAQRRIDAGLEDLFVRKRFERTPLLDHIEAYETFRPLHSAAGYWRGDLLFAGKALRAGLVGYASDILKERIKPRLGDAPAGDVLETMALSLSLGDDAYVLRLADDARARGLAAGLEAEMAEFETVAAWRLAIAADAETPAAQLSAWGASEAARWAWIDKDWFNYGLLTSGARDGGSSGSGKRRAIARYLLRVDGSSKWPPAAPEADKIGSPAPPAAGETFTERSSAAFRRRLDDAERVVDLEQALPAQAAAEVET